MAQPDRSRLLRAGALQAEYHQGDLRFARLGDLPVLDRLYVRIRDHSWGTVPMRAQLVELNQPGDTFRVKSRLSWGEQPWASGVLEVTGSDSELFASATITFHRPASVQRVGLNLHHPLASTTGHSYHWASGSSAGTGIFPEFIYPQLREGASYLPMIGPFHQLTVDADPHTQFTLSFRGDLFETEDQRNWTDASFKTYGPPVDHRGPRLQEAGSVVQQSVRLTVLSTAPGQRLRPRRASAGPGEILVGAAPAPALPPLGVTAHSLWPGTGGPALAETAAAHVRADVWPESADSVQQLRQVLTAVRDTGLPLELALRGGELAPGRVTQVLELVAGIPVRAILAVGPGTDPVAAGFAATVRYLALQAGIRAPVAAGTAGHFSEINRSRASVQEAGTVVWSTTPQVHESDDATVMQGAPMVGQTVASASQIWPAQGTAVSGIRLASPQAADRRADRPFAAAWLVAVLAGLTGTRCEWLTVDLPLAGRRAPAPAAVVLRAVRQFAGLPLARVPGPGPGLAVLAAHQPGGLRLLVANLTGRRAQRVVLPGRVRQAEVISGGRPGPVDYAAGQPELTLAPFGVVHATVAR